MKLYLAKLNFGRGFDGQFFNSFEFEELEGEYKDGGNSYKDCNGGWTSLINDMLTKGISIHVQYGIITVCQAFETNISNKEQKEVRINMLKEIKKYKEDIKQKKIAEINAELECLDKIISKGDSNETETN